MADDSAELKVDIGPDPCVSTSILDHYRQQVTPRLDKDDEFYSYRYFKQKKFFHGKYDEHTPEKKMLFKLCPKPRITAFTQGSVYFPYDDREEVLKMIAYDASVGSIMYWNQIAHDVEGEGCRLTIDLDSDTRVLNKVEIYKMSRVLWKTLKAYYSDFDENPIDIFVAKCGPRIKKGNLSTGVHMICHVKVTVQQAKQIIFGLKLRLTRDDTFNMRGIEVDAAIYKEKGKQCSARMIYCNKIEKCPLCEDKVEKRQGCNFCNRMGHVISKSTYEPMSCVYPKTGRHDIEYFRAKNPDFLNIVKNYSIWPEASDERTTYAKPSVDPMYTVQKAYKEAGPGNSTGRKRKGRSAQERKLKRVKHSDPSYTLLEEFIHNLKWKGNQWWDGIVIDNIALTENERVAWVYVSGMGCTMCPYAMKDHGDNRIWFGVTRGGWLTVYCHSKKKEYGCSDPKNRIKFELPGRITQKLFGIKGPPGFDRPPRDDNERHFSFQEFVQRQGHGHDTHMRPRNVEAINREKLLRRLSEFYELGQTTNSST
jgi:hypothetical protein